MTLKDFVLQMETDPEFEAFGSFVLDIREIGEYGGYSELPVSRVEIDHKNKRIVFVD